MFFCETRIGICVDIDGVKRIVFVSFPSLPASGVARLRSRRASRALPGAPCACRRPGRRQVERDGTSGQVGANKKRSVCSPVPDCQPILILTSCGHGHGGGHAGRTRRAPAPASPVHPGRRRGRRRIEREREGKAGGNLSKKTAGACLEPPIQYSTRYRHTRGHEPWRLARGRARVGGSQVTPWRTVCSQDFLFFVI